MATLQEVDRAAVSLVDGQGDEARLRALQARLDRLILRLSDDPQPQPQLRLVESPAPSDDA